MFTALRRALSELLHVTLALSILFLFWKALCIFTATSVPLIVVVSGSMEPTFWRGDVLFVWNRTERVAVGDIPVVWFKGHPLPMVHRAIKTFDDESVTMAETDATAQVFVTKGDNNDVDDVALYPTGRKTVRRSEVVGFVRGYFPFVGWPAILVQEQLSKLVRLLIYFMLNRDGG